MPDNTTKSYLSAPVYDFLKAILTIVFPAFSALYLGLDALWGLPAAQQVVGTVALLATFLGVVLMVSSGRYKDDPEGEMLVTVNPDGTIQPSLSLNKTPEELAQMNQVRFKVTPNTGPMPPDFVNGPVDDPNV